MSTPQRPEPGYSTLEVVQDPREDTTKEVAHPNAPEVLVSEEKESAQHDKYGVASRKRRILGLSLRTFIIIVVIGIAVVVGAIVGGVVGSRRSSRDSTLPSSTPTPSTTPGSYLLGDSKLAASNYTDADGYVHRSVFFQDSTSALIGQLWDSQNKTWKTINITQQLPGANVLSGTPIASSSLDFGGQRIHIWCLLADQSIHGYYWGGQGDPSETKWAEEATIGTNKQVVKQGSSLASAWQRPFSANSTNMGSWVVAFQKPDGEVVVANNSGSSTTAINSNAVAPLTSLAITSELTRGILSRLTLTYESNGKVLKVSYTDGEWDTDADEKTAIFNGLPVSSPVSGLATTTFDHWSQVLFLALLHNGTLRANWYDDGFKPLSTIELSGGPESSFSAIATTSDAMFYGILNDSILEYSINTSNPQTFEFVGIVYP